MTVDEEKSLRRLERNVELLLDKYKTLKNELDAKNEALRQCQDKIEELSKANEELKHSNSFLSMAKSFEGKDFQNDELRSMLSDMIKEIDTCIASLSNE